MNSHFDKAIDAWGKLITDAMEFGYHAMLAVQDEGKTIRDLSIALCGNSGLEDRIGRYVMAAQFVQNLRSVSYENVKEWLTPSHYTELYKHERAYDHEAALELMQELITENPDGSVNVKPVEWIRARRQAEEISTEEIFHRLWRVAAKALTEAYSVLERRGALATQQDRRRVRVLKLAIAIFQAEKEKQ